MPVLPRLTAERCNMFQDKQIVLGVSGGIAAYKAVDLASHLRQLGADVHCIMTDHAARLVSPVTFGEITGHEVAQAMFDHITRWDVGHISLARMADLFVIAPATADIIGKIASGIADDMLSTTVMATKAPVLVVPSMNTQMYENPFVQENMEKLRRAGYTVMEPDAGHLACNTEGKGRFPKTEDILEEAEKILTGRRLLKGKKILVSAGGTREKIDPVRYIGNRSSGRMGYAIARAAYMEDAEVVLVSCTRDLPEPRGVTVVYAEDARGLDAEMNRLYDRADGVIMAAAVSDYRPSVSSDRKIKKEDHSSLDIRLELNPDILRGLGARKSHQFLVGFAAETNDVIAHGKEKLERKNLDMLIANDVSQPGAGFNVSTNIASILYRGGKMEQFPIMSKDELGRIIAERVAEGIKKGSC